MIVDVKSTKVYLISPGENNYRDRALTVFSRLLDLGFKNIIFFKSVPGPNSTASLTNTVLEIFKKEIYNFEPFFIIEDDCESLTKYDKLELPDNWDLLYVGVSKWAYPHSINTLYNKPRPNIVNNSSDTVKTFNDDLVKINSMTSTHAILYNSREFIRTFINKMNEISKNVNDLPHDLLFSTLHSSFNVFGLKNPMFYQDSKLGGQEDVTKLTFNGECYC
jgi:hypothetical protein